MVWVAGEPGIGKSTLIEHFMAGLPDAACVRGQCVEQHGAGEPYLPVLEALGELCRRDGAVAPLLRAVAPTWLLQLPWLSTAEERDALRRELAGVGPDRMLREMGELLDRYTERTPLLLVTEDLHWSDRSTIQLMDYIARRRAGGSFMWLASFRLAEVVALDHPLNPLRRELRAHGLATEIVLDTFSEAEVSRYVEERAPALVADEGFVRALHERTDGLPLFVASVLGEVLSARGAADLGQMAVPENLAAIIDHYIARLGERHRALLSAAAVCGAEFRVHTVADVLGRDPVSVGQDCEELLRERLWLSPARATEGGNAREPPYAFRHALFRQVLGERTAPAARVQLHRKVGAALERERAAGIAVAPAELATHFDNGAEPAAALRYYAEASAAALLSFSPTECLALAQRGLSLLDQAPDTAATTELEMTLATLEGLAAGHLRGVSSAEAKAAYARAYAHLGEFPQHPLRGLLLHGFGLGLCVRAEYGEALAMAERSHELGSAANDPVALAVGCYVRGNVHMLQGHPRLAREWLERGLAAIAARDAAPDEHFMVDPHVTMLGMLGLQLLHLGEVDLGARVHGGGPRPRASLGPADDAHHRALARRPGRAASRRRRPGHGARAGDGRDRRRLRAGAGA